MKIPTRERQRGLNFNITPLIDIVFLLIIFFLAASHLARSESLEAVELPHASKTQDDENRSPRRLVVTVTLKHEMFVGGKQVDMQQIEQMILAGHNSNTGDRFEVRIRSDKRVPYRLVEPIMLACVRSGVTKVGFVALPD